MVNLFIFYIFTYFIWFRFLHFLFPLMLEKCFFAELENNQQLQVFFLFFFIPVLNISSVSVGGCRAEKVIYKITGLVWLQVLLFWAGVSIQLGKIHPYSIIYCFLTLLYIFIIYCIAPCVLYTVNLLFELYIVIVCVILHLLYYCIIFKLELSMNSTAPALIAMYSYVYT